MRAEKKGALRFREERTRAGEIGERVLLDGEAVFASASWMRIVGVMGEARGEEGAGAVAAAEEGGASAIFEGHVEFRIGVYG